MKEKFKYQSDLRDSGSFRVIDGGIWPIYNPVPTFGTLVPASFQQQADRWFVARLSAGRHEEGEEDGQGHGGSTPTAMSKPTAFSIKATYDLNTTGCLILTVDPADQAAIKAMVDDHGCDFCGNCEANALEGLLCNSELDWIGPEEIGALTSAPILGIRDKEKPLPEGVPDFMVHVVGHWDDTTWYEPVIAAWGFMDYQVRSFLEDIITTGKAVFVGGAVGDE